MLAPSQTDEPVVPIKRGKAVPVDKFAQLPRSAALEAARRLVEDLAVQADEARQAYQAENSRLRALNRSAPDAAATAACMIYGQAQSRHNAASVKLADERRKHADVLIGHVNAHADDVKGSLLLAAARMEAECARILMVADAIARDTGASSHKLFDATRRMRASLGSLNISLR